MRKVSSEDWGYKLNTRYRCVSTRVHVHTNTHMYSYIRVHTCGCGWASTVQVSLNVSFSWINLSRRGNVNCGLLSMSGYSTSNSLKTFFGLCSGSNKVSKVLSAEQKIHQNEISVQRQNLLVTSEVIWYLRVTISWHEASHLPNELTARTVYVPSSSPFLTRLIFKPYVLPKDTKN